MSEEPASTSAAPTGSHNQSVLRATTILRCFVDHGEGQTLSELARRTGISVSATHRILQTLVAGGILRREESTDRYLPGIVLLALAGVTYATEGLEPHAQMLREIADRVGESASLAIRDDTCAVVLLSAESSQRLRFSHRPGTRVPLHSSPLGHALLAASQRSASEEVRSLLPLAPIGPGHDVDPSDLTERIEEVRAVGHAIGEELPWPGVRAVAVAFPPNPAIVGGDPMVLAVHAPAHRLDDERGEQIVALLGDVAAQLAGVPTRSHGADR